MKIAVYGGTFDPIHHAHLILAREAREMLGLKKIIFVPAAVSPLKGSPVASAEMRLLMLRAAIEDEAEFAADDCELRRSPPSYTIDTIEEIQAREGDTEIYYLIGDDNVPALAKWHRFDDLKKAVRFGRNQLTHIQSCTGGSTSRPQKSERGLPAASRFAISYRSQSRKSFRAKNFTRSNRNNARKPSKNLR